MVPFLVFVNHNYDETTKMDENLPISSSTLDLYNPLKKTYDSCR